MPKQPDGTYTADVVGRYFGPEDLDEADRHPILETNIFYPEGVGPFPIVCVASLAAWHGGSMRDTITTSQAVAHKALEAGIAVAWFVPAVARGPNTANNISDATYDPGAGLFGAAYRGNGVLYAPQDWPATGNMPSDYTTAYPSRPHMWLDDLWLAPEKSAVWLVQHLRHYKADLDLNGRIGSYGTSAGANALLRPLYGRDQADDAEAGQKSASSRLDVAVGSGAACHYLAFKRDTITGRHWPDPASTPDYDQPAEFIGDVVTPFVAMLNWSGAVYFGQLDAGLIAANEAVPVHWHYSTRSGAPGETDGVYSKSVPSLPSDAETEVHSSWFGHELKFVFGGAGNVRLTCATGADDPSAPAAAAVDAYLDDADAVAVDLVATLTAALLTDTEPAEEQVMQALEERLRTVTVDNGYLTDVKAVHRFPHAPHQLLQWPVIEVRRAGSRKDDRAYANVMRETLTVDLALVLGSWQHQEERLSRFIADVELALAADCTLGGKVRDVVITGDERVAADRGESQVAVAFATAELTFLYPKTDPYTLHTAPTAS